MSCILHRHKGDVLNDFVLARFKFRASGAFYCLSHIKEGDKRVPLRDYMYQYPISSKILQQKIFDWGIPKSDVVSKSLTNMDFAFICFCISYELILYS